MRAYPVVTSRRSELVPVTDLVQAAVRELGVRDGVVTVFVPHTTAGITINENADPDVVRDLLTALERLVPWRSDWAHEEGNAAAHVKASLMGSSVRVLVEGGRLRLGTWQGIFLCEFDGPRTRQIWVSAG
ncbi:MAG: secondary thiamine-phosphate synthase enzyme YjbQ [Kiritimatiellae bacterium]|nr:secondary thiamine-phosphate synthase enzyme YjbQ [Kiritimatiellia bacterium]